MWKVAAKGGKDKPLSWQGDVAEGNAKDFAETLWPPSNAAELGLEKWWVDSFAERAHLLIRFSLRLVPHDQNTGGFFVCVLQKAEELDEEEQIASTEAEPTSETVPATTKGQLDTTSAETSAAQEPETGNSLKRAAPSSPAGPSAESKPKAGPPAKRQRRDATFKEDPFSFVDPEHEEVKRITSVPFPVYGSTSMLIRQAMVPSQGVVPSRRSHGPKRIWRPPSSHVPRQPYHQGELTEESRLFS